MRPSTLFHALLTGVSALGAGRLVVMPLLQERHARGNYLWGHYSLPEIYLGFPLLAVFAVCAVVWLLPKTKRARLGLRLGMAASAVLVALVGFDLAHAFVIRGALRPDFWLDSAHIARGDNLPHPKLGFVRRPHAKWDGTIPGTDIAVAYRADANGFRNEVAPTSAEIVFVGDSYTEAAQMPLGQTFPVLVGARSSRSIANLGRGAYGPQQEAFVIETYATALKPKVVVWQWFDGNDLRDAEQYLEWQSGRGELLPLTERFFENSFFRPFLENTYRSKRGEYVELLLPSGAVGTSLRYRWMPHQATDRAKGWAAAKLALGAGVAKASSAGAKVVVMFVPVAALIWREHLRFRDAKDAAAYAPKADGGEDDLATVLERECAALDVGFLDLTPIFRAESQKSIEGLFITHDEHFDRRGHEVTADAILAFLARAGL
ncbi:MAG: hypothetical protein AB7I19_18530 [Planctomycetota bacterium]